MGRNMHQIKIRGNRIEALREFGYSFFHVLPATIDGFPPDRDHLIQRGNQGAVALGMLLIDDENFGVPLYLKKNFEIAA